MVIVTDDNPRRRRPGDDPRGGDAGQSRGHRGGRPGRGDFARRRHALQPGDALLIAGKGHETGQIVGDDVLPFDDAEQASVAVAALEGGLA